MNTIATRPLAIPAPSAPRDPIRLAATLLAGAAMGAILTVAAISQLRPAAFTTNAGVSVTDGWAHSPITRLGGVTVVSGQAVADGWAHSPFTRLGGAFNPNAGVAVTDGWAHSPLTRAGATDSRAAQLRYLAISYQNQGPAVEARAR